MNRIFKRTKWLYILPIAFLVGLTILAVLFGTNARKWVMQPYNKHIYSSSGLVGGATLYDRNGEVLVQTVDGQRKYNDNATKRKATLHVVGDAEGYISTGAQTAFASQLTGYDLVNGLYSMKDTPHDLTLTVDAGLSATAYKALTEQGYDKGCVGVYNYKTGEILCAVSLPTYDIENKPDIDTSKDKWDAVYMNRFLKGRYTPGSTFKVVTAASALENVDNIMDQSFNCNGAYTVVRGSQVKCNGVHGHVTFRQALNRSCNSAFAAIASAELTNDQLTATAEEFGFNKAVTVNGIECATSTFTLKDAYAIDRAWTGIGQGQTMVNPCHEITIMGAIANKTGATPNPTLIEKSVNIGTLNYISSEVATQLDDLLRSNVTNYYSDSNFPNLKMCGKTGTAQVSGKEPHTLFVGYSQRDDLPLAIVVVLENSGGYGLTNCIPIANTIMQDAMDRYVVSE